MPLGGFLWILWSSIVHLVLCITTMLSVIVRVSYLIHQFNLDLIIHTILGLHPIFVVFHITKPAFLDQVADW